MNSPIEELLNGINRDMLTSRKDGFKQQQEHALWGMVTGLVLMVAMGYWCVYSCFIAIEKDMWFMAALSGWQLKLAVDGLGTFFGAVAKYRSLERSTAKQEVVGL